MSKIQATVVADSINPQKDRLTSVLVTMPRIILSEMNTHRMLSKNTSSSRAIPFKKMVEAIQDNPFIPIAWQKDHKGMQGTEYLGIEDKILSERNWIEARDNAIEIAERLNTSVTKQLCNRLLEPFMWTTMLITGSREGWDNFFELRCPSYEVPYPKEVKKYKSKKEVRKENHNLTINYTDSNWLELNKGQAEIHMMALAEEIYDAINESTPKQLESGQWHIPFGDKINVNDVKEIIINNLKLNGEDYGELEISKWYNEVQYEKVKISTAMAARTSYTIVGDEKEVDYKKMIELHDRLLSQDPPHSSPLEHCARAMSEIEYTGSKKTGYSTIKEGQDDGKGYGWCNNLKGFIPYRYMIDNNLIK